MFKKLDLKYIKYMKLSGEDFFYIHFAMHPKIRWTGGWIDMW